MKYSVIESAIANKQQANKCTVGDKFSFKKIFKTEYYHTNYDKYDYSDFE